MDHHICTDVLRRPLVGGARATAVFGPMLAGPGTFLRSVHVSLLLTAAVAGITAATALRLPHAGVSSRKGSG